MAGTGCYDITGNDVACTDPSAYYDSSFQILTATQGLSDYVPTQGQPGFVGPEYIPSSTPAQVGVNADGGNSSGIGAALSSVTKAISSVFGTVYGATNPAKPGSVINPATGQPYSVGQQLQLSGIFANPLLLIIIIVAVVMLNKKH